MTPRQSQVIQLAAQGLCNKRIASALGIATSTVKCHLATARLRDAKLVPDRRGLRVNPVPHVAVPSAYTAIPSFLELKA